MDIWSLRFEPGRRTDTKAKTALPTFESSRSDNPHRYTGETGRYLIVMRLLVLVSGRPDSTGHSLFPRREHSE